MEFKNLTYLLLLSGTIGVPLALSFEKELKFYTRLKYLLPAIVITAAMFIIWDTGFTKAGIWSFNQDYTIGINLLNLPVEEWLFFICVPYSLSFINEVLRLKTPELVKPVILLLVSGVLLIGFVILAWLNREKLYTFNNFLFLSVYLGYALVRNKYRDHFYWFYATWLISLVPFLIMNGILTSLPVVEYNPQHIMGIRIFTIPIEDFGYLFLLYLMTDTIYRILEERRYY